MMVDQSPSWYLLPELWVEIFRLGTIRDFKGMLITSKSFHDLFWESARDYDLSCKRLSDKELYHIGKRSKGEIVNLDGSIFPEFSLIYLCKLNLIRLEIRGTNCKDSVVKIICKTFPNLLHLNLSGLPIIDETISLLTSLIRLEVLLLERCDKTTELSHIHLEKLTTLKHLVISSSSTVLLARDKGSGIPVLMTNIISLREELGDLKFSHFTDLIKLEILDTGPFMPNTPKFVESISRLHSLRYLRIQQGQLLNRESLSKIGSMTQLLELHLYRCQLINDFNDLLNLKSLRFLSLKLCSITDTHLISFASFPSLTELEISECHKLTGRGVDEFYSAIKDSSLVVITIAW